MDMVLPGIKLMRYLCDPWPLDFHHPKPWDMHSIHRILFLSVHVLVIAINEGPFSDRLFPKSNPDGKVLSIEWLAFSMWNTTLFLILKTKQPYLLILYLLAMLFKNVAVPSDKWSLSLN